MGSRRARLIKARARRCFWFCGAAAVAALVGSSEVGRRAARLHLYLMLPVGPAAMNNSSHASFLVSHLSPPHTRSLRSRSSEGSGTLGVWVLRVASVSLQRFCRGCRPKLYSHIGGSASVAPPCGSWPRARQVNAGHGRRNPSTGPSEEGPSASSSFLSEMICKLQIWTLICAGPGPSRPRRAAASDLFLRCRVAPPHQRVAVGAVSQLSRL